MTPEKLSNKENPKRFIYGYPWEDEIDKISWEIWKQGCEERRWRGGNNKKEQDYYDGRTERKNKERDILIEGIIMELARKLTVEKVLEINKNNHS